MHAPAPQTARIARAACLALLIPTSVLAQPVTAVRSLSNAICPPGTQVTVTIDLEVDEGNRPSGVIVVETIPAGATLVTATPPQSSFDQTTREARWLFGGPSGPVSDDDSITYVVDVSQSAAAGLTFSGELRFNDSGGSPQVVAIAGDSSCVGGGQPTPIPTVTRIPEEPTPTFAVPTPTTSTRTPSPTRTADTSGGGGGGGSGCEVGPPKGGSLAAVLPLIVLALLFRRAAR